MQKAPRQFLFDLLETRSPSGSEMEATRVWLDYVGRYADEVETDAYGNAFAVLNPKGSPTVMFEGHSDEIGLMVTYIDDDGFLWVGAIGGVDPKMMLGKPVIVHTPEGSVNGILGAIAPHCQTAEMRTKSPTMTDLFVDIGAKNKAEALKIVRIGTPITLDHGPTMLLGDNLAARACDNKIGIWSSAEGLRRYAKSAGKARLVAASHVQEETGLIGAQMGSYKWQPDVAIVVDVTNATDCPCVEKHLRNEIKMGDGAAIRVGPSCHPQVVERLEKVAQKRKFNLQRVPIPGRSGTNANAIYPTAGGIPTAILSTPNRYMHSPSETINLKDLDQIPTIMADFAAGLKPKDSFKAFALK